MLYCELGLNLDSGDASNRLRGRESLIYGGSKWSVLNTSVRCNQINDHMDTFL